MLGGSQYRLKGLLTLNEHRRDQAQIQLAQVQRQLKVQQDCMQQLQDVLKKHRHDIAVYQAQVRQKTFTSQATVHHLREQEHFIKRLRDEEKQHQANIEAQKVHVDKAERDVAQARAYLLHTMTEVRKIQKHKEMWQHSQHQQALRKEQQEIDEIGLSMHNHKQS